MNFSNDFDNIACYIEQNAQSFVFNTSDLPDTKDFSTHIVKHPKFEGLFQMLHWFDVNTIYWFEANSVEDCRNLVNHLKIERLELHKTRVLPPINGESKSKTLYVGKRQGGKKKDGFTHISGRMVHHLGYYKVGSTQGLQLVHWAKAQNCQLTIKFYKFDALSNEHLRAIENIMSGYLNPMLGKHY